MHILRRMRFGTVVGIFGTILAICMPSRPSPYASSLHTRPPRAKLGYATYVGTSLSNGIDQYLGIRFAAPPLGDLRFRRPQPPNVERTTQQADSFGPICPLHVIDSKDNEDCLFLNLWAPSYLDPQAKYPVFFFIQGGGYVENSNANYNGSGLVAATGNNMVFVSINYRVGPYGFLASERLRLNGDLNVGLLDQRFALQWVKQHIASFGGDPDHVVIVGDSAGAGSIAMHLVAYNGAPTNLFVGAFGVSPFFPTQPYVSELEWQFDLILERTGCSESEDPVGCLRTTDVGTLNAARFPMIYPGRNTSILFGFTPAIDGDFLVDYPYNLMERGKFVKVPIVFGDDTNEGTIFAPNASSPADVSNFLMDYYPKLTAFQADTINLVYPKIAPLPQHAAYFPSAAAAYGESTFICPGLALCSAFSKHTKSWNYRYDGLTAEAAASGLGVVHTAEIPNVFGAGNTDVTPSTPSLTPTLQAYYTSFVRTLDPNSFRLNDSAPWSEYMDKLPVRLLIQANGTSTEAVPEAQGKRCAFWKTLATIMEQ